MDEPLKFSLIDDLMVKFYHPKRQNAGSSQGGISKIELYHCTYSLKS
jgi:hypothetical protein